MPDTRELKLAVLSPDHTRRAGTTEGFARELLEKCGQTFSTYRNTLLLLVADEAELAGVWQRIKRSLALCAIRDDKAIMRQLSEENKKGLETKLKDAESGIAHHVLSAYRHLAKASEQGLRWMDFGLPTVGVKHSLAGRVREYLRGEDMLLAKISPQRILEKTLRPDEKEKSVEEIYEAFLKYPHLPMLESKQVLLDSLCRGVEDGTFGVRTGNRTWFKERVAPSQLEADAILVREPKIAGPTVEPGIEGPEVQPPASAVREPGGAMRQPTAPPESAIRCYRLQATIPWDKLSDFVRGVVSPLHHDGAELEVKVALEARSEAGIKQVTLDQKVRETLKQIGAKVIEEKAD